MIRWILPILLASLNVVAMENTALVQCDLHFKDNIVQLTLDSVGKSFLKITDTLSKNKAEVDSCDIKLSHISGSPRKQMPGYSLVWRVGVCRGKMQEVKKVMFDDIRMNIDLLAKKPVGLVQWLQNQDVEECVLSKFRGEEIQRALNDRRKKKKN